MAALMMLDTTAESGSSIDQRCHLIG